MGDRPDRPGFMADRALSYLKKKDTSINFFFSHRWTFSLTLRTSLVAVCNGPSAAIITIITVVKTDASALIGTVQYMPYAMTVALSLIDSMLVLNGSSVRKWQDLALRTGRHFHQETSRVLLLAFRRLKANRQPLKLHFIYLFNKYRHWIFLTRYILSVFFLSSKCSSFHNSNVFWFLYYSHFIYRVC